MQGRIAEMMRRSGRPVHLISDEEEGPTWVPACHDEGLPLVH